MTFEELVAAVIIDIKRPDMGFVSQGGDGRIPQQVAASTFALHTWDGEFFYKDIKTAQVIFDTAAYIQSLDTSTMLRFRSLSYFRKNNPALATYQQNPTILPPLLDYLPGGAIVATSDETALLTPIDVTDLFDYEYGFERYDVVYQVGNSIMIKSTTPLQYILAGWYAYPGIDPTNNYVNYESWIATEHPFAIVYHAASAILQKIGRTDSARKYDDPKTGLATSAISALVKSNITVAGK